MPLNIVTEETLSTRILEDLNVVLQRASRYERTPSNEFVKISHTAEKVFVPQGLNEFDTTIFDRNGVHTSGRRDNIVGFCKNGLIPFSTPVNDSLTEVPAVFCGVISNDDSFTEAETFKRSYGDIFNSESHGFIVLLDPSVAETSGYEADLAEARIKVTIPSAKALALIVGNETAYRETVNAVRLYGPTVPVVLLKETREKD